MTFEFVSLSQAESRRICILRMAVERIERQSPVFLSSNTIVGSHATAVTAGVAAAI
jgi:hypothetical protein